MKIITLKLTKLEQKVLQHQLWENICSGSCFMHNQTGHFPRHDCDFNCPKMKALANIKVQLENQLEKDKENKNE